MRRVAFLIPLAVLLAACGGETLGELPPAAPAPPQRASLDWDERYPSEGDHALRFTVASFAVTRTGWEARVGIANETDVAWEIGKHAVEVKRFFGIALFPTGSLEDVDRLNREGRLPPVRGAESFTPTLPDVLEAGRTWSGVIGGSGRLPSGVWVRVVFGPLVAVGTPPKGLDPSAVWYTDHAYELRAQELGTPA